MHLLLAEPLFTQEWHPGGEFKKRVLPFYQDDLGEHKERGEAVTTHQNAALEGDLDPGC